jgi:hypothetical protein
MSGAASTPGTARVGPHPDACGFLGRTVALIVFAVAMGWLEGVVVVYIRGLLGFGYGAAVLDPAEMVRRFVALPWLVPVEQTREAATILMLGAAGWLAGRRLASRFGAFLIAFGIWDIVYYIALWSLLRWPPSLGTVDVLFLIPPGPWWNQPVWVPVAISCVMIAAGSWLFARADAQRPGRSDVS